MNSVISIYVCGNVQIAFKISIKRTEDLNTFTIVLCERYCWKDVCTSDLSYGAPRITYELSKLPYKCRYFIVTKNILQWVIEI